MKRENYKIGDIVWAKFNGEGHIQRGVRPAVIIQNNVGNKYSPTIQVVPLTSKMNKKSLPTHVMIPAHTAGLTKNSIAQCEGVRPIQKVDIKGIMGKMPDEYMGAISIACIISMPIISYLSQDEVIKMYHSVVA